MKRPRNKKYFYEWLISKTGQHIETIKIWDDLKEKKITTAIIELQSIDKDAIIGKILSDPYQGVTFQSYIPVLNQIIMDENGFTFFESFANGYLTREFKLIK